jgi:hypothetical protein
MRGFLALIESATILVGSQILEAAEQNVTIGDGKERSLALKDQRLGIEWVRQNIAGFGGDPVIFQSQTPFFAISKTENI